MTFPDINDERTAPVYTRVNYTYRDADNYKQFGSVLLDGTISDEQKCIVAACLDGGELFIPEQIGWPHPGKEAMTDWSDGGDHCFCELDVEDPETFEVVGPDGRRTAEPVFGTVEAWMRQMLEAKGLGWDVGRYGVSA